MPYSKKRTYRRKPRRSNRRRYKRKSKLTLTGFPSTKMVRLRYVKPFSITTGSALSTCANFVANGMAYPWLPNQGTGITNDQPRGFDEWMGVYNHYQVLGARISVQCTSATHEAVMWGVAQAGSPDSVNNKGVAEILSGKKCGPYRITGSHVPNQAGSWNNRCVTTYSQKKNFGKNSVGDGSLIGAHNLNPPEDWIFSPWLVPNQQSGSPATAYFIATIDYIALLTEPKVLPMS